MINKVVKSNAFYGRTDLVIHLKNFLLPDTKEMLGFSGIEFSFGPYFNAPGKDFPGVQIDLVFDRKDNVITLCEMKYSLKPVGLDIIDEVERKAELINNQFKNKTIQKVLISRSDPTRDFAACGFFYRIIKPEEFF